MKKLFILIFLSLLIQKSNLFSQDIDLFNKQLNDKFIMPDIDKDMKFQEFQILSRDLRMKHMLYAMVVPGYVHFYTHENKLGYVMLGTRVLGYTGLTYILLNNNAVDFKSLIGLNFDQNVFPENERTKYTTITTASLMFIFGSYLFDWIHGQHMLQTKQEKIRFKYSLKLQSTTFNNLGSINSNYKITIPTANITLFF